MQVKTILASVFAMLAVFLSPLPAACCHMVKAQPVEQAHQSCCMKQMRPGASTTNQPLTPPCKSREGRCLGCTHIIMTHAGCTADAAILSASTGSAGLPLWLLAVAMPFASLDCPATASHPLINFPVMGDAARSLCAQHCLLIV